MQSYGLYEVESLFVAILTFLANFNGRPLAKVALAKSLKAIQC